LFSATKYPISGYIYTLFAEIISLIKAFRIWIFEFFGIEIIKIPNQENGKIENIVDGKNLDCIIDYVKKENYFFKENFLFKE
jgi:hypothetical protein